MWVYTGAWWGLKSKMLVFHWFYHYFLKGQGGQEPGKRTTGRKVPSGRGKGEGKPSPLWACLRFWEVWRVCWIVQGIYTPRGRASADFQNRLEKSSIRTTRHANLRNLVHSGVGSNIRIMDSYHGFQSWVRIMGSYHGFGS